MNGLTIPVVFLLLCCALACQKDEIITSYEQIYVSPLHVRFELQDTGQTAPITYLFEPRIIQDTDTLLYYWKELGKWDSGFSPPEQFVWIYEPWEAMAFYLRFQPAESIQRARWLEERVSFLFQVGRVYPFGTGPGKVDVGVVLGEPSPLNDLTSKASFLTYQQGELLITDVVPYRYQNRFGDWIEGHLIHCNFEGKLGRYDEEGVQLAGQENFKTTVQVDIRHGKAIFFIEGN